MTRLSDDWLSLPSIDLDPAAAALASLVTAGLLPQLSGFVTRSTLDAITRTGRLPDGTPWLAPMTLPVPSSLAATTPGQRLGLRDFEGAPIATLIVDDVWTGADGARHVGGRIEAVPGSATARLRPGPASPATEEDAVARWSRRVAVPVTLGVSASALAAAEAAAGDDGGLLWLVVEPPGDDRRLSIHAVLEGVQAIRAATATPGRLVRCVAALPVEAAARLLFQAALARALGATHVVVAGADAGMRLPDGTPVPAAIRELGLEPVRHGGTVLGDDALSALLTSDADLPADTLHGEVEAALRRSIPPRWARGLTVFFTGLSGSGKSTIATRLRARLRERGRRVTLLDGDLVRRHLSSELGFSQADRRTNIERIAFVAAEIGRHGGTTICAPIAPYDETRRAARTMVERAGGVFVLVYVDTPLAVCEARDRKGLYAKARAGLIPAFTGVSDPYEPPADAEVTIDTMAGTPDDAVERLLSWLEERRYLPAVSPLR